MSISGTATIRKAVLGTVGPLAMCMAMGTGTAFADAPRINALQKTDLRHSLGEHIAETYPLGLVGQSLDEATLDWRTPTQRFDFRLPPSDWVETLTLTLHADPIAPRDATRRTGRDIRIRLNGAAPEIVRLERAGFTARIPLDTRNIRTGINHVDIDLMTAPGVSCLTAADGGWTIDLQRSRLDTRARAKSRPVFISELRAYLETPTPKPRTIGIQAYGPAKTTHEALIAQGLSLRTPQPPRFRLDTANPGAGGLSVIAGTRLQLAGTLSDPTILQGQGPRLAIPRGRPLRLVITGDTDADVRRGLDAFAVWQLPDARRRIVTPDSLKFAGHLHTDAQTLKGRKRIADLGGLDFSANWGAGPDAVEFDLVDPASARARLTLDLERADFVSADSTVDVAVNGRSLGRATLDTDRIKLDYVIPQGWLKGRGNTLQLTPDLLPTAPGCAPAVSASGIRVLPRSRLDLQVAGHSSTGDLSRLTAGASPLTQSGGDGTHVVLPRDRDTREDALRILGRIAQANGSGLVNATYGDTPRTDSDLILFETEMALDAPRSVRNALAENSRGNVAALYPDAGRWIGVIAPQRAGSLSSAANAITGDAWHDLSGGVSRFDGDSVDVAHIAYASPAPVTLPRPRMRLDSLRFPDIDFSNVHFSNVDLSDVDLADVPLPRLDITSVTRDLETTAIASADTLSKGWGRLSVPLLDRRDQLRLRGTFGAPRAVVTPLTAAQVDAFASTAGLDLGAAETAMARSAARMRERLGIEPLRLRSTWMDRRFSFAAMLLMLAFGLSTFILSRSNTHYR